MMHLKHIRHKKLLSIVTLILIFALTSLPLFAASDARVFDEAELFSPDEITELENTIADVKANYPLDIAIVTTSDNGGKSSEAYADDFYDEHGFGYNGSEDGLLLLIDMDAREVYISTAGTMIQYFTDSRISTMLDHATAYLGDGKYYSAADRFLRDVQSYVDAGIPSDQYTVEGDFVYSPENTPHKPFTNKYGDPLTPTNIAVSAGVSALIALIIALIVRAIIIGVYKHPHHTVPETKPNQSSIHYSERDDHFVTSHTSRVRIESNSSSGGGSHSSGRSSVHHSSGGHSHGGGGRKF